MNIFKTLKTADVVTLASLVTGMLSIFYALQKTFVVAAGFLLLAVVFDALDGIVARKKKQANVFGKELDSLSDLVSFGVAPAVFGFQLGLQDVVSVLVIVAFVLAGALRLCRFNVTSEKGYEGLPITLNGILFPLLFFISLVVPFQLWTYTFAYALMSVLMVATFRITKPW